MAINALKHLQNKHLIHSAAAGDMKGVVLAIKLKAQINARDKDGWTAAMHAFANYHADVVKYLKEHGGKMSMEDEMNAQIAAHLGKSVRVVGHSAHAHKRLARV